MGFLTRVFRGQHGAFETTSMGILFVPFFVGVVALFYDASKKWAWGLTLLGIPILTIEIISRMRFYLDGKMTHFMMHHVCRWNGDDVAQLFAGQRGVERNREK